MAVRGKLVGKTLVGVNLMALVEAAAPGDFALSLDQNGKAAAMIYQCPCGCGIVGRLRFRGSDSGVHPSWEFDGNEAAPTLKPSVDHVGHWHGWLTAGEWKSV